MKDSKGASIGVLLMVLGNLAYFCYLTYAAS